MKYVLRHGREKKIWQEPTPKMQRTERARTDTVARFFHTWVGPRHLIIHSV